MVTGYVLGIKEDSRIGVIQALWNYIKINGLQDKLTIVKSRLMITFAQYVSILGFELLVPITTRYLIAGIFFIGFGLIFTGEGFAVALWFLCQILIICPRECCAHANRRANLSRVPPTIMQLWFSGSVMQIDCHALHLMHIDGSSVLLGLHMVHSRSTVSSW